MSTFRTGQLPAPTGDRLVGRDSDLQRVQHALSRSNCVTIIGPGGVGKTRLATEAARIVSAAWKMKSAFIDLRGIDDDDPVDEVIVAALRDSGGAGDSMTAVIQSVSPLLIVLDNLEQLSQSGARSVTAVIEADPEQRVRIINTSRQPIGAPGEHVLALEPLGVEDAHELLRERALDAGAPVEGLEVLLRRLGGLPLAIELIAPRLRVLGPNDLLAVLDEDALLDESFDWSWKLLHDDERRDLGLLAPNAAPLSLVDAARTLDVSLHEAAGRLQKLVDASLLQVRRVGGASQYVMLEPIRRCAVHKLRDEHPTLYGTAVRRHAESWLEELPANPSLTGIARIVRECEAVEPELAVRVAIRSLDPLYVRHNAAAASRIVRRALDACTPTMTEQRIDLLCVAAEVWARHLRELRRATELVDEAFALGADSPSRRVSVRNARGLVALGQDDFETADRWLTEAAALVPDTPDDPAGASAFANLGLCRLATGKFADAAEWMRRALDAELPAEQHHVVQGRLAIALFHSERVDEARQLLHEGREDARRDGLEGVELSYAMHLGRLRIDPQPRAAIDAALASDDPAIWLDGALLAWTLGDGSALQRLEHTALEHVAPLTLGIATAAAALTVLDDRALEAAELARRAIALVPSREAATRAIISRIAFEASQRAGRSREASSWQQAAQSEAERSGAQSVIELVGGAAVTPMFAVLVTERAATEQRYTRWSWVDLALAFEPSRVAEPAVAHPAVSWRFANEARMVQCPDGKTLNLGRRGAMRKILWRLAERHSSAPGEGLSVDDVFEVGWPGEILDYELALARVYNTIRAARSLGFEELIVTQDDGYLFDPDANVVLI